MACFKPKRVIMDRDGLIIWTDDPPEDVYESRVLIKCGRCLGCRRAVQRDWSLRNYHEALQYTENWQDAETGVSTALPESCVITLTYDEDHLPEDAALNHKDFQDFFKRVRIAHVRKWARDKRPGTPRPLRFFMCGEYGIKGRPHYHAIVYGSTFGERYLEHSRDGQINAMSYDLDHLWSQPVTGDDPRGPRSKIGRASVDDFSYVGAAYVAGYVMKKAGEEHLGPWIEVLNEKTGEIVPKALKPEYRSSSVKPGIGNEFARKNLHRIYEDDECRIGEYSFKPPKYYDKVLEELRPDLLKVVKERRLDWMRESYDEWTPERCSAAEQIAISRLDSREQHLS